VLNPHLQKYADQFEKLIPYGDDLIKNSANGELGRYILDGGSYMAWQTQCLHLLLLVFGKDSVYFVNFSEQPSSWSHTNNSEQGLIRLRIVEAAYSDMKSGLMDGPEMGIAANIFDNVLEQAKHLNYKNYKDPAAILGRTVIEDALKRLARKHRLDDSKKTSVINEDLKSSGFYHQPMWRQIQAWIDIGNSAAHGDFHEYDQEQVRKMLEGIEAFLVNHFS
jgi:hypothetical protein